MFIAICDSTYYGIYATGKTEEEAKSILWDLVSNYLKEQQAPETSEMRHAELEEFFGVNVINTVEKPCGFL